MAETDPDNWTDLGLELDAILEMCFKSHLAVARREYGGTEMMTSARRNVVEKHPSEIGNGFKEKTKNDPYIDPRDYCLLPTMPESH